jgi:hypothetical protein
MRVHKKIGLILIVIYMTLSGVSAGELSVTKIDVQGVVPVAESFAVVQNPDALNFNLADSRNSSVVVGTYTLISNNSLSLFRMYIKPGEDGKGERFTFVLDSNGNGQNGQNGQRKETVLPFVVRVTSGITGAENVEGENPMQKEIGIKGIYATNDEITYETGEIIADIPDFNLDDYANGWYSSSIQLSLEAH